MTYKKTAKFFLPLSLLLLYCFIFSAAAIGQRGRNLGKPAQLEARLKLYKNRYLLREPIWVKVSATNVGEQSGWFYFVTFEGLRIKDSRGSSFPCHISSSLFPVTVESGVTLEKEDNILFYFGRSESEYKSWWYLPPATYTIYYELNKNTRSSVDTFQVVEPTGDEAKAMNLLKESFDLLAVKKIDDALKKINRLIKNYPQCSYAPFAMLRKISIYRIYLEDLDKALTTCYRLISAHVRSREAVRCVEIISAVHQTKKDKNGFVNAMNNLIKKYPESDISREAEKQLEQVKDKDFE